MCVSGLGHCQTLKCTKLCARRLPATLASAVTVLLSLDNCILICGGLEIMLAVHFITVALRMAGMLLA